MKRRVRRGLEVSFFLHVALSLVVFLSLERDLGRGALRSALDTAADAYATVGFGDMPLGMVFVAAALWLPAALLRDRRRRPAD